MAAVTASNTLATNFQESITYGVGSQSANVAAPVTLRSIFAASGSAADQCNLIYEATLTLAASTPQVLDLTNLTDLFGAAVNFARVRFVAIRVNSQVNGAVLLVGANGTNDWTGLCTGAATTTLIVYPSTANNDGFAAWQMPNTTGAAVSSTNKVIKLNPGSNAMTVDVLIAGCNS